ncbi:MAG: tRNA lysidine(34) synthetase TilS [Campylobacter sp.]|nr:tRNA lysidine(34) synthetase TilS [Campylobacter sp.]
MLKLEGVDEAREILAGNLDDINLQNLALNLSEFRKNSEISQNQKALLAFSHGTDSTALFYLLEHYGIEFDIALINYNTRKTSLDEANSAKDLAAKFNKQIYIKSVNFSLQTSNFEKKARDIRYEFFDEICHKFGYKVLIFAHQLNDLFEWFLMRLSKGSGLVNALGMDVFSTKNGVVIWRPLLQTSRDELLDFLKDRDTFYYTDASNSNTKFQRNFIREKFSNEFIRIYKDGLKNSMKFLSNDKTILLGEFVYQKDEFFIIKNDEKWLNLADKALKKLGVVISQKGRLEINKDCVVNAKVCICKSRNLIFIAPFQKCVMDKSFKEKCRILKIPPLIRPYLYKQENIFKDLQNLIKS